MRGESDRNGRVSQANRQANWSRRESLHPEIPSKNIALLPINTARCICVATETGRMPVPETNGSGPDLDTHHIYIRTKRLLLFTTRKLQNNSHIGAIFNVHPIFRKIRQQLRASLTRMRLISSLVPNRALRSAYDFLSILRSTQYKTKINIIHS